MEALIDRVFALLNAQSPDIGVLDRQQQQNAAAQEILGGGTGRPQRAMGDCR